MVRDEHGKRDLSPSIFEVALKITTCSSFTVSTQLIALSNLSFQMELEPAIVVIYIFLFLSLQCKQHFEFYKITICIFLKIMNEFTAKI